MVVVAVVVSTNKSKTALVQKRLQIKKQIKKIKKKRKKYNSLIKVKTQARLYGRKLAGIQWRLKLVKVELKIHNI